MNLKDLFNRKKPEPVNEVILPERTLDERIQASVNTGEMEELESLGDNLKSEMVTKLTEFGLSLPAIHSIPKHPTLGYHPIVSAMTAMARSVVYAADKTLEVYTSGGGTAALGTNEDETILTINFFGETDVSEISNDSKPHLLLSLNGVLQGMILEEGGVSEAMVQTTKSMARCITDGEELEDVYRTFEAVSYGRRLAGLMTVGPLLGLANGTEHKVPSLMPKVLTMFEA